MNAKDINQSYDLLTLAQGDTELKRAGAYYIGACPFCGGRDRFNLKETTQGWRWLCRNCTEARYKSPIDYIMRRDNLDFKQALESLGGDTISPRERVIPEPLALVLPDQAWQSQRWQEVLQANDALNEIELSAQLARLYLQERALDRATWFDYLLGFAVMWNRPAIVIPWYDQTNTITAVKYRFIDDQARDPGKRYSMARDSKTILFGLQSAAGDDVLVFVEGEINAMSIMQVSTDELLNIDALSFGSETGSREDMLNRVAQDYKHVIVWADNPEKATAIRASLARPADVLCSPEIDGMKYDANALLQKAWLADFLRETCQEPHPIV